MSSTTNRSPDFPESTSESSSAEASHIEKPTMLLKPPARPKLVAPPKRPEVEVEKPSAPQPSHSPVAEKEQVLTAAPDKAVIQPNLPRQQPISPPSEPMQYRAIGLVRGCYQPSEEQFNRGNLLTEDEVAINAVLLGRVTSLIKKHLDLDKPHLWVVYPRTRDKTEDSDLDLHVQIVGVWEPETLNQPDQPSDEAASEAATVESEAATVESEAAVAEPAKSEAATVESEAAVAEPKAATVESEAATAVSSEATTAPPEKKTPTEAMASTKIVSVESGAQAKDSKTSLDANGSELNLQDNYFSIRGEVINYSEEAQQIIVKILQCAKRPSDEAKSFKLMVRGVLTGKTVGYFWDLDVQRQNRSLVLQAASPIGAVPPKKRAKKKAGFRSGSSAGRNQRPKPKRDVKSASTNSAPNVVIKKLDKAQRSDV